MDGAAPSIRRAHVDDARAIAAVKAESWRSTYSSWVPGELMDPLLAPSRLVPEIVALLSGGLPSIVATRDGRLLGFAVVAAGSGGEAHLESFHVRAQMRGRGLGRTMLSRLADELIARGASEMSVHVVEQNVPSRRLYERLGARYVTSAPSTWAPAALREAHYLWPDLADLRRLAAAP